MTLVIMGVYAAAQLNAGSKALHALFGWPYQTGAVIGALIVVAYCFAGGIRASIWTDVMQSIIMYAAMLLLAVMTLIACGGLAEMWASLERIDPVLVSFTPLHAEGGLFLFAAGWMFAGLG